MDSDKVENRPEKGSKYDERRIDEMRLRRNGLFGIPKFFVNGLKSQPRFCLCGCGFSPAWCPNKKEELRG